MSFLSGFMGIGTKNNESTTTNQTQTTYTDKSANAGGDGSLALAENSQNLQAGANGIAVGTGGSVNITTSDPTTVAAALHTVEANNALTAAQYAASLNTLIGSQTVSSNQQKQTQDAANLAIQSTQSLASQLSGAGPLQTPQSNASIVQTVGKYAAAVAIALVVVVGFVIFTRKKS